MAHRSNQAVASQDRPLPQPPEDPPPRRRLLAGWATAVAALAISLILLGAGLWLVRYSIASFMLGAALAERGAEANFEVIHLDLNGAALANVRFGSETSPDASIPLIEARWRWQGLAPRLHFLRLVRPRLHVRVDQAGRMSAGALDRITGGPPGARRPRLPEIELEILEGQALINAPFGDLTATLEGSGTLGRDFSAIGRIERTSRPGRDFALEGGEAELIVVSRDENIAFRLTASARALTWANARVISPTVRVLGRAPLDLARYDIEATGGAASYRSSGVRTQTVTVAAGFEGFAQENSLAPTTWAGEARAGAADLRVGETRAQHARFEARVDGDGERGQGAWTLGASRFDGFALTSERPSAEGAFRFELEGNETLTGQARISLAQSQLNAAAQEDLRAAFPDLPDAPVGPTFARAESALDAAADRFDLTLPIVIGADEEGVRLQIAQAAHARAANGATLQLSPLRQDAPALALEWPGPVLHGAIALELAGGGAPDASLLLDTVNWTPGAPFEADGTLTLANWRAESASIAADELGFSIVREARGGRVELRGPARVTGPLGDGEVRDLVAVLDLAILWDAGWRVTTNSGCLPIRLGGLDAAGLSFGSGAFSLCPLGGVLIAADAASNLSGGFSIRSLALNGRMAGPNAQPARVSAGNVVGIFRGRTGDFTLALEADTPRLSIEMGQDRTFAVAMQRITADARIADSWRVAGTFESGTLNDPALPGAVSTIAGSWTAQPIDDKPVIRVSAAEALLTANRPASDAQRPLFHPLRIVEANGELREGAITASGAILLEDRGRQLARFAAHHDIDEGVGAATVTAESIVFGPQLQPYEITERARGLVENVRGPVVATADIGWSREAIVSTGRVRLDGVSLATATIPIVNDVHGEVAFDDLFALTTPPGQQVTIGELNPGIAVSNGRVQFQLLDQSRVSIERAEFAFASGVLAMSPTTITLGADETRFELTLRDVDAADLLQALNVPDVTATGQLEGNFPLLLTRQSAFIHGGVLRSQGDGGVLSYTGQAGEEATGISRIAFDALRSFRYDSLSLTLDGDLNGEVVSSIEFSGRNSGRPVDLGPIAPVPGLGRVTVRGVPFDFNVRVTAPFRRLAQTGATITDPGSLIEQAQPEEASEPVDPDTPPPKIKSSFRAYSARGGYEGSQEFRVMRAHLLTGLGAAVIAAGCIPVQIQAPDEPIEINLNVNIRQEVIVRLERDAAELLEENSELFGAPTP
ncbi:MAG: YnbE family lipoprotein [Caulobacteraceae bacterium]